MMSVLHLTSADFDAKIGKGKALVDFWASWCGPCKMVAPVIEELAAEYDGRAIVAKVDVDDEGELATRYNVMSIPTVIIFENGEEVKRLIGARRKADYQAELG